MSIIHFKYHNAVDGGTVSVFSSQLTTLPATNIQNGIKSKIWRTEDDFVVNARNNLLPFHNSKSADALSYAIPSATYTGATLAAKIQSGLNATGDYTDHYCSYAGSKFTIKRSSTSDGFLRLSFDDPDTKDDTIAVLLGFDHATGYNSADRIYTSTVAVLGNEHEINIDLSATQTVSAFIVDNHNLTETGTMILRGATQSGLFSGPYNLEEGIALSTTVTITSGLISLEPSAPEIIIGGDCEGVPTEFIDNGDCEGGNAWRDMIDRGDCESATTPAMKNELSATIDNCTWVRSAEESNGGTYSFKHTKAIASGTASTVYLADDTGTTNLHGMIPGRIYKLSMDILVTTASGMAVGEADIAIQYYNSGAWVDIRRSPSVLDIWKTIEYWLTLPSTATGFRLGVFATGTAADTEFFYTDNIEIEEVAFPVIRGEDQITPTNATVELSSSQANGGTYSLKIVKTTAAFGGQVDVYLHDALDVADLRGLTAGRWYKAECKMYVPSSGGPLANEVRLAIREYVSAAWVTTNALPTTQDAFETLQIIFQADSTIASFALRLTIVSAAAANEYIYVDDISLEELTPPMVRGEITPSLFNASGTFSTTQVAAGSLAIKMTKNNAAGTGARWRFCDTADTTDMHGFLPGESYIFAVKVYTPAVQTGKGTDVIVRLLQSISGAAQAVVAQSTGTLENAFEIITVHGTFSANATGMSLDVSMDATFAISEIIYFDSVAVTGPKLYKTLQLYWHDRTLDKSELGRIWAGEYFEPAGKQTNTISFNRKTQLNRSTVMVTQSGAAYFNKKQKLKEWLLSVDPLDQYYNNTTKVGYEDMLDEVENNTPFYISFEDQLYSSTVYGYLVGNNVFNRNKNTPMFNLRDLVFREQR